MKTRISKILTHLNIGMYERDEVTALCLLSALADGSVFLLGYPGVGKSLVARRLKLAFAGAKSFEYLMSRFSTPDEIFGPVSISKLKEADTYERITCGYLPESEIVFLDEIWKAGPAIQNTLLTALNEKIYLNGNKVLRLPVKVIIAASNELPAEDEGLEALWDRFIVRYVVEPISRRSNFESMLFNAIDTPDADIDPLTGAECDIISQKSKEVILPDNIIDVIFNIRERLNIRMTADDDVAVNSRGYPNLKYYISDRRWKKAVGVLRTSAFLNDRNRVDYSDLLLLVHMLWNDSDTIEEMHHMVCEEIASMLFKTILDKNKSAKRHASSRNAETLHTDDGMHYVVVCDGFNLKIRISDYNRLLETGEYTFASETQDGRLVLSEKGSYSIQVTTPGTVNINGYNYPLAKSVDRQIDMQDLYIFADNIDDILTRILSQVSENIFVNESRFAPLLKSVFTTYKSKLKR